MKKHLFLFAIAVLTLVGVIMLFYFSSWKNSSQLQGKLVFANTYNQGLILDKIKIKTAEENVELVYEDNYWLLNSSHKYYADFSKIHKLLTFFNKTTFEVRLPSSEEDVKNNFLNNPEVQRDNSGILLQTFSKGKLLDEIILGTNSVGGNYFFAKNFDDDYIWLIDNYFDLPTTIYGWLPAPVLNILIDTVESVRIDDEIAQRVNKNAYFSDSEGRKVVVDALLNVFMNVFIRDVWDEAGFKKNVKVINERKIELVTFNGLKIECRVFVAENNQVWINIKLLTTPLPKTVVHDYIKDNLFLYDGKYFNVASNQGHVLRYFRLF